MSTIAEKYRVLGAEQKRTEEIARLCHTAGHPELAGALVNEGVSVDTAAARLRGMAMADSAARAAAEAANPDLRYQREYRENPAFAAAGMSEADYVASRRADVAGIELAPASC